MFAAPAIAKPTGDVFHYACRTDDSHYALTLNFDAKGSHGVVKMQDNGPSGERTTFRILKDKDDCGKGGWTLSNNATFCYATQGYGTLTWHGKDIECDQADTD